MKTTAQSQDLQTLDYLAGLLVVLFTFFITVQFIAPPLSSPGDYIASIYAQSRVK